MDAFFAAVEQLDFPHLAGKPVLVGHDGPRGVVAAASYEARRYGCRSAMPMSQAKRRCPQAMIVPGRRHRYAEVSRQVFSLFEEITPLVQPLSIDEAFLDVSGSVASLGSPPAIARALKRRVLRTTGLTASVGVAQNKFLAKLASDMDKPDGLTVVPTHSVEAWLAPLPLSRMWGVGPVTEGRLAQRGLRTFGDVAATDPETLRQLLGDSAQRFHLLAQGIDHRPVTPDSEAKSIGREQTFESDLATPDEVRTVLLRQLEEVALRLRRKGRSARTVTVKIRYGDFETITRSHTLPRGTTRTLPLWRSARLLFDRWADESFRPVRLIGVSASGLGDEDHQLDLFQDPTAQREREVDAVTDAIKERFGGAAIRRAAAMPDSGTKDSRRSNPRKPKAVSDDAVQSRDFPS